MVYCTWRCDLVRVAILSGGVSVLVEGGVWRVSLVWGVWVQVLPRAGFSPLPAVSDTILLVYCVRVRVRVREEY